MYESFKNVVKLRISHDSFKLDKNECMQPFFLEGHDSQSQQTLLNKVNLMHACKHMHNKYVKSNLNLV